MNKQELEKILELHKRWIDGEDGGVKADFTGANLGGADLRIADLRGANLTGADLRGATLGGANLKGTLFSICEEWRAVQWIKRS